MSGTPPPEENQGAQAPDLVLPPVTEEWFHTIMDAFMLRCAGLEIRVFEIIQLSPERRNRLAYLPGCVLHEAIMAEVSAPYRSMMRYVSDNLREAEMVQNQALNGNETQPLPEKSQTEDETGDPPQDQHAEYGRWLWAVP